MNSKRKAEIQRRLSLSAVPTPPDGLADRIKSDIPKYLQATEIERARFSRSIAFNMRVAAAILLLVTSLVVTMRVLSPNAPAVAMRTAAAAPAGVQAPQQREALRDVAASSASAVDELRVEISEESAPVQRAAQSTSGSRQAQGVYAFSDATSQAAPARAEGGVIGGVEGGIVGGVVGGVVGGSVGGSAARRDEVRIAEAAPAPAFGGVPSAEVAANYTGPSEPAPPAVTAPAPAAPSPQMASRAAAPSSSLVREAMAADLALAPKSSVFGISVDPAAFERVKETIERGARPAASAVNVEALVNYFAGSAPKRIRRDVQLEAEGSPLPVEANGRRGIVRFTVDTRTKDLAANATTPPIATNARVEVDFNPQAVASFRRIGDPDATSAEPTLLSNTSVTGLYEVDLKPTISASTRIATVTLHYDSIEDGRAKTRVVVVRGSDFARKWTLASRRHRLAALGAVWGESLQGSGPGSDVAVKAEELATQAPHDARARELAAVTKVDSEQ